MVKDKHKTGYFYTAGITSAKFAPDVPISILVNQKQIKKPKTVHLKRKLSNNCCLN